MLSWIAHVAAPMQGISSASMLALEGLTRQPAFQLTQMLMSSTSKEICWAMGLHN